MRLRLAGDSRAVLSRSGKAIELTRDHKPLEPMERQRIELCGGFVCSDGRLCGELAVARAIGDYHFPNLKGLADGETGKLSVGLIYCCLLIFYCILLDLGHVICCSEAYARRNILAASNQALESQSD